VTEAEEEAALTARLSKFVRGARALQMDAADRVARSLMQEAQQQQQQQQQQADGGGGVGSANSARELSSLKSAVSAFIAAAVHKPVLQVLRRAYEHEDIALAAKLSIWATLTDQELLHHQLPPRPPIKQHNTQHNTQDNTQHTQDATADTADEGTVEFDLDEGALVLAGLEEGVTPEEQLLTVKRATWAIKGAQSLPADDLLPLFVELLAKATPPYLFSTLCYINFFYVPPTVVGGGGAGGDELSYHATNLRAAAAIIGLRCPWDSIGGGREERSGGGGGAGGRQEQQEQQEQGATAAAGSMLAGSVLESSAILSIEEEDGEAEEGE
jgi:hypothetical protein